MAYEKDEVADFSNFMKSKNKPSAITNPAIQELEPLVRLTKRIKWMLGILIVLTIIQIAFFFINKREAGPVIPDGMRLVFPPNEPARLEPIQK